MSDHGFGPTSTRVIYLNRYLAELGLLKLHNADNAWYHPRSLIHYAIKTADGVIRGALSPQQKAKVAKWFPILRRKWESQYTGLSNIDWSNTKAYCSEILTFPASIWINLKGLRPQGAVNPGAEYERVIQFIIERLYDLKDPVTKKQFINHVYRREEIYHGPYLNHAPDLTLSWWDGSPFLGKPSFPMNSNRDVIGYEEGRHREGEWSGLHSLEGILVLQGKYFKNGKMLGHSEIIDIAPTLLHLLNLPIPEDMDGSVLHEAFKEEFTAVHSVLKKMVSDYKGQFINETYSNDEAAMVEERLRGLGYIE
jgi:predicted AlkP superfamily phosphohydrolase/phosphomutase